MSREVVTTLEKISEKKQVANRRLWIEALRSGKYKQAAGRLQRTVFGKQMHCCLGVACEVLDHGWPREDGFYKVNVKIGSKFSGTADDFFEMILGISRDHKDQLMQWNDNKDMDFVQIANWVEKTYAEK